MEQIEVDRAVPHIQIHFVNRRVFEQRAARTVNQDIEAAEFLYALIDRLLDRIFTRHVSLDINRLSSRIPQFLFGTAPDFRIDINQRHFCALSDKSECTCLRDACSSSRKKRDLAGHSSHAPSIIVILVRLRSDMH